MYALLSDLHLHNWSAFSITNKDGVNSRLRIIINELIRAAEELKKAEGRTLIIAGDLFHVRGSIAPSVLNPVLDAFWYITHNLKLEVIAIPGNHDLESKDSTALTNAADALRTVNVRLANEAGHYYMSGSDTDAVLIPWRDNIAELKMEIENLGKERYARKSDLIIHAPVDGVIVGLPEHGLTADWLAEQGFKRVFSGHYHNHVDFGNSVYSIGATTHQTWSDAHSKAGFLLVDDEAVSYQASHAPNFYDLDPETDLDDVPLLVDGNYVRVTMEIEKESQIAEMREFLKESGALGSVIHPIKKAASVSRTGATVKSGASLTTSVGEFIKAKAYKREKELTKLCTDILAEAEVA